MLSRVSDTMGGLVDPRSAHRESLQSVDFPATTEAMIRKRPLTAAAERSQVLDTAVLFTAVP